MARKILVIEDDPSITEVISYHLQDNGFEVECAADGPSGLEKALKGEYALVILDLNLPGISGIVVCQEIRSRHAALPVIILTSRGEEIDRVVGLEVGADDYVIKPFSAYELMARVRARLRVASLITADAGPPYVKPQLLEMGPLSIDIDRRVITTNGQPLPLSRKEFNVLVYLFENQSRTVSRAELLQEIWGSTLASYEETVGTLVGRLRRKLEQRMPDHFFIRTVRGVGYRLSDISEITRPPQGDGED